MNDKASKAPQPQELKKVTYAAELPKEVAQTFFRYMFSKENSLIELFPNPIVIRLKDIEELNARIAEKIRHYDVYDARFDAVASYENRRSEQYGTWDAFVKDDWTSPDVLDQMLLNWRFMIKFPNASKPASYVVNVRLASEMKPQHLMQALFSKNPDDVERIELEMVPMCCRVDFVDPLLSQELLNIVGDWNKGRPSPAHVFPIMRYLQRHSDSIQSLIHYSVPVATALACVAYYWSKTHALDTSLPATTALIVNSMLWLAGTGAAIFITSIVGYLVGQYLERQLDRYGRFSVFNFTKGDDKRQTELLARSANSFWKFIGSGAVAILWNVSAAILCAMFLKTN